MVPKTRWATTIDGASIAYQDLGQGRLTLVVIHGWISHLEVYWEQPRFARFMRRLSRNLRVLHFDKRGTGMSDRIAHAPDLETRMDDVRAVMDAAGVDRAALLGWGTGGPPLALFFAATHPDRAVAVCTDANLLERNDAEYVWGDDEAEEEQWFEVTPSWGDEETLQVIGFGEQVGDAPLEDPGFRSWFAKFARYSATPTSRIALDRMWYDTDIRDTLTSVHTPTAVFYKRDRVGWGDRENAKYLADHVPGAQLIAVEGSAPVVWIEEPEPLVGAIEAFLGSVEDEQKEFDRVLATVLFTDIVGSTERAVEIGDRAWTELLERHHQIVRAMLSRYRGVEVDTAGDGFFATFDGPGRAVRCAQAIIAAMQPLDLQIRAGLHTGEIERTAEKVGGLAVHIGARLGAVANASQVVASSTVRDLVVGSGLSFEDLGWHDLRGVPEQWHLYRVAPDRSGA